ncbi:MAG TPA: conjugal transfer protein TraR [Campylobacteraceae bacterium]|jgi:DnaK suppressor protein|nr:conjugal transfer protein TraR [Campylobacteraceae bacterium]
MQKRDDLDLNDFKTLLLKEKARLEQEIADVENEINTIAAEDEIDDVEDMAELKVDNDRDHAVLDALKSELKDVEDALKKIAEGSYGFDEKTGKPIPRERLMAYPAARTAV